VVIDLEELQNDNDAGPFDVGFRGGARVLYVP
jgi:hypothetical protein